ncbi:MAG: hypothetical protein KatS3mg105_2274 [Gemmatales bacterium]|nr:MAG: hypothetical protein KatS3mg105_2274 [Gemmatales bacterium]
MYCQLKTRQTQASRWLIACLGVMVVANAGCSQFAPTKALCRPRVVRGAAPESNIVWKRSASSRTDQRPQRVQYLPPSESIPEPSSAVEGAEKWRPAGSKPTLSASGDSPQVALVSLDTVLRLAEEQNPKIALVRERVRQAYAEKELAAARWLPDLYVGTAFYRHEGGIQNFPGNLVRSSTGAMFAGLEINSQFDIREYAYRKLQAQRRIWQERGELAKITTETILEAADTYIDLLTARSGEAVAREIEAVLTWLLDNAKKTAAVDKAAYVEVARIEAQLHAQRQVLHKVRQQAAAASTKLAYLLGIDPCTEVIPVDRRLVPIDLVDATPPVSQLVAVALTSGPGVQELNGLLNLIHESQEKAKGASQWLPVLGIRMAEGGFGAGAGDQLTWDNRWDLGLQARWNLTDMFTRKYREQAAHAKVQQAYLAYEELRNRLTAGVHEARQAIHATKAQVQLGQKQIERAQVALELSKKRLQEGVKGSTHSEVLLAIRSVALGQISYLQALNAYNKAHIRLFVLLGPDACLH